VLEHVLARVRWETDFFIFSNTSMDTLDYTSGKVNEGSKAMLLGLGDPVRDIPKEFRGELPNGITSAQAFCGGCLVVKGADYLEEPDQAARLAKDETFAEWPLVILHDDTNV
jgi:3-polyprenyl-4-hydroxybenzoate decarboxylase